MGLATSQVRLLALTSRKSDVEFNMQLNAKRKTMLLRESTTLSKLYYAKLQQARYQYSTEEGYNDVTYGYIMGAKNSNIEPTIEQIKNDKNGEYFTRNCPGAFVIDANGNVVVNDELFEKIKKTYDSTKDERTNVLNTIAEMIGEKTLATKLINEFNQNRKLAREGNETFTGWDLVSEALTAKEPGVQAYSPMYYLIQNGNKYDLIYCKQSFKANEYSQYRKNTKYVTIIAEGITKEEFDGLKNIYNYYGDMLKYIYKDKNCRIAEEDGQNSAYTKLLDVDYLQEAFRSGTFTLSTLQDNKDYMQGLDYFINKSYFVEKADTESRETITAWYNAKKAELDEKETYWDSEINALSTELETINTEMESIKSLRDNAIQTTFKWGAA